MTEQIKKHKANSDLFEIKAISPSYTRAYKLFFT